MNPNHMFLKVHFNIILPSTPWFSKWFFPHNCTTKTIIFLLPMHDSFLAHVIAFDLIILIMSGEECIL
jgi:hypothetical protein